MTNAEAKQAVQEIAADIFGDRGDIPADKVKVWATAYSHWQAACESLSEEEIDDAIWEARMNWLEPCAADYENSQFEDMGHAAFGNEE